MFELGVELLDLCCHLRHFNRMGRRIVFCLQMKVFDDNALLLELLFQRSSVFRFEADEVVESLLLLLQGYLLLGHNHQGDLHLFHRTRLIP